MVRPHYTKTTASAKDNLISLAYQAAEDGVEFMFVQDIEGDTCADGKEIKLGSSEVDDSVIYVQILDSAK